MSTVRIGIIGAGVIGRTHIQTMLREPTLRDRRYRRSDSRRGRIRPAAGHSALRRPPRPAGSARPRGRHHRHANRIARAHSALTAPPGVFRCWWRNRSRPPSNWPRNSPPPPRKAGVPVLVGHHRRHNPIIAKAREIVRSGRLGRLTSVTALWTLQKPDDYYDIEWRRKPGGGPVLTNLIHDIDTVRFICGEIESLQAVVSNAGAGIAVQRHRRRDAAFRRTARWARSACPTPWRRPGRGI